MPYHRNKQMLLYTTELLNRIVPEDVEIIIVGNNDDVNELNIELSNRFTYLKFEKSLLYSETVNRGVNASHGELLLYVIKIFSVTKIGIHHYLTNYYQMVILAL